MKNRLITMVLCASAFGASAQWRNTFEDGNHNHYSVEKWERNTVMAGTHDSNTNIIKIDDQGNTVWDISHDFGADERCFDVCVVNSEKIAVTGYSSSGGNGPGMFVAEFDNSGVLLNSKRLDFEEPIESVGLDLIFSEREDAYFIAGYTSNAVTDRTADKSGMLVRVDNNLDVVWMRSLTGGGVSDENNAAGDVTELPGIGVFVTGQAETINSNTTAMHLLFNYSGALTWNLSNESTNSHQCGVDAVYDQESDELYIMSNNSVFHSFEINKVINASSSTASISYTGVNSLYNQIGNTAGYSLELGLNGGTLIVGGMLRNMDYNGVQTDNSPSFIAELDRGNFDVNWLKYRETSNQGYRDDDHDVFQAFDGQQAFINYPDILCVSGERHYQLIEYSGDKGNYNVILSQANTSGVVESAQECMHEFTDVAVERTISMYGIAINDPSPTTSKFDQEKADVNHDIVEGCTEVADCGIEVSGFYQNYVDCYKYEFIPVVTANPGTVITSYVWSFGQTTTSSSVIHDFGNSQCMHYVCVTVNAIGANGLACSSTHCHWVGMTVPPSCGSCGSQAMQGTQGMVKSLGGDSPKSVLYPNPASERVGIELAETADKVDYKLFDVSGKLVFEGSSFETSHIDLNVSDFDSGNYLLKINIDGTEENHKLVIE